MKFRSFQKLILFPINAAYSKFIENSWNKIKNNRNERNAYKKLMLITLKFYI